MKASLNSIILGGVLSARYLMALETLCYWLCSGRRTNDRVHSVGQTGSLATFLRNYSFDTPLVCTLLQSMLLASSHSPWLAYRPVHPNIFA
ncbi:hypothetical protein BDW74DRAFT_162985 [Aspergillus multicolor]|uniref:uncharacterized protein n=1 Tax=Aspergillus multicolor TaxID=41759 RepID=UPI003CCD54CA